MDVGGVLLDRLREHRVDEADDRGVVLALHEVGGLGQALCEPREVGLSLDALDDLAGLAAPAFVGLAQELVERRLGNAFDHQRDAEEAAELGDGGGRRALAVDDLRLAVGDAAHQHAVALCEGEREAPDRRDRLRRARDHRSGPVTAAASPGPAAAEAGLRAEAPVARPAVLAADPG